MDLLISPIIFLVLLAEIMDFNAFPEECTHLVALGDSKVHYQLQIFQRRAMCWKRECDLSTPSSAGLCKYLLGWLRGRSGEMLGVVCCAIMSRFPYCTGASMTNHPEGINTKPVTRLVCDFVLNLVFQLVLACVFWGIPSNISPMQEDLEVDFNSLPLGWQQKIWNRSKKIFFSPR